MTLESCRRLLHSAAREAGGDHLHDGDVAGMKDEAQSQYPVKRKKKTWHFQKIRLFALWQVGGNIDPSAVFAAKYEATAGSGFSSTGLSRNTKNLKPRSFNPYHGRLTFLQPFFSVREIKAGKTTVFLVTTPPPRRHVCEIWESFTPFFFHTLLIAACQRIINGGAAPLGHKQATISHFFS